MSDLLKSFGIIFSVVFGLTLAIYGGWKFAVEIIKVLSGAS